MSIKDYFYLSSLNIRRNSSRSFKTIFSLVLGITLSILSLFALFAFYTSILGKLDNNIDFNTFTIHYYTKEQYNTYPNGEVKVIETYLYGDIDSFLKILMD